MKRFLSAVVFASVLAAFSGVSINAQTVDDEAKLIAKAKKIHAEVITLDTHNDIDTRNFTDAVNYIQDLPNQVNLPKMTRWMC